MFFAVTAVATCERILSAWAYKVDILRRLAAYRTVSPAALVLPGQMLVRPGITP